MLHSATQQQPPAYPCLRRGCGRGGLCTPPRRTARKWTKKTANPSPVPSFRHGCPLCLDERPRRARARRAAAQPRGCRPRQRARSQGTVKPFMPVGPAAPHAAAPPPGPPPHAAAPAAARRRARRRPLARALRARVPHLCRLTAAAAPAQTTTCLSDVNLIISGTNLAFLSLGRFVFLPYQRDQARHLDPRGLAARAAPYLAQLGRFASRFQRARSRGGPLCVALSARSHARRRNPGALNAQRRRRWPRRARRCRTA